MSLSMLPGKKFGTRFTSTAARTCGRNLLLRLESLPPHIAEHNHAQRRREGDGEDAAEETAEESRADHEGDDDHERMQADAASHDARGGQGAVLDSRPGTV